MSWVRTGAGGGRRGAGTGAGDSLEMEAQLDAVSTFGGRGGPALQPVYLHDRPPPPRRAAEEPLEGFTLEDEDVDVRLEPDLNRISEMMQMVGGDYCNSLIKETMQTSSPHSPQSANVMGVFLEVKKNPLNPEVPEYIPKAYENGTPNKNTLAADMYATSSQQTTPEEATTAPEEASVKLGGNMEILIMKDIKEANEMAKTNQSACRKRNVAIASLLQLRASNSTSNSSRSSPEKKKTQTIKLFTPEDFEKSSNELAPKLEQKIHVPKPAKIETPPTVTVNNSKISDNKLDDKHETDKMVEKWLTESESLGKNSDFNDIELKVQKTQVKPASTTDLLNKKIKFVPSPSSTSTPPKVVSPVSSHSNNVVKDFVPSSKAKELSKKFQQLAEEREQKIQQEKEDWRVKLEREMKVIEEKKQKEELEKEKQRREEEEKIEEEEYIKRCWEQIQLQTRAEIFHIDDVAIAEFQASQEMLAAGNESLEVIQVDVSPEEFQANQQALADELSALYSD